MVRHNIPGIDHVHVPAGPVLQSKAGDAHVLAVAQVDQPSSGPARNGVLIFTFLHLVAQSGDIIVLAGKGHETYQILKDETIHLDEREVIKEALAEIGGEDR